MLTGVLLTAGESSRMGRPKALLPFGAGTFSKSVLAALQQGGVSQMMVVVGHVPGPIVAHLCEMGPRFVYNADWPKGQLSSLQAAIRACQPSVSGILVALVDQPGLRASTVRRMVRAHRRHRDQILVAGFGGRPGHPVIFPRRFFWELLAAPLSKGARAVVQRHAQDRILVSTGDPAVVRDVDTSREYSAMVAPSN